VSYYDSSKTEIITLPPVTLPESVDWRERGAVNEIVDLGSNCNAGWAFAAIASVEGFHQVQTGQLFKLSEQECVDCDGKSNHCNGGGMENCLNFIKGNKVSLSSDYPYTGKGQNCNGNAKNKGVVALFQWFGLDKNSATMKNALTKGVISTKMCAGNQDFLNYKSGIYNNPKCCPSNWFQSVNIVGYGVEDG